MDVKKLSLEEAKRRNVIRNKDRGNLWYFRLSKMFNEDIERGVKPRDLTKRYGYSKSSISHIKDIYPRLKDTEELYIYNFSNMDLVNLARVENETFRKVLVERAKEKPSVWIQAKATLCNVIAEYMEGRARAEDYEAIIPILMTQEDEVVVKNAVDSMLEKPICYIHEGKTWKN